MNKDVIQASILIQHALLVRRLKKYFDSCRFFSPALNYFLACDCNTDGTVGGSQSCSNAGVCHCKDGYYGDKCQGRIWNLKKSLSNA